MNPNTNNVTVILTIWKRDHIEEQMEALLGQSLRPSEIWIYHCRDYIQLDEQFFQKYPMVKYQKNTHDLGYFGRFSLGLHASSKYLYILDDDVIPSSTWLETCHNLCEQHNAIISSSGRIIIKNDYHPERIDSKGKVRQCFAGDGQNLPYNQCEEDTLVDYGCNSWFIKADWLVHFWQLRPFTKATGEDMHLSASLKLSAGIMTLVPKQNKVTLCGNLKRFYGFDDKASWKAKDFISKRKAILQYLIDDCGWRPKLW